MALLFTNWGISQAIPIGQVEKTEVKITGLFQKIDSQHYLVFIIG
ncbi:hypothetical protein Anacy_2157 [Anabaena cylindrica PCC 7122]|uniref:Uncharacterized protein n=1 Tax=Anabaena cylindrica (strain ATCC 27899 / PCC 7122) TaxID=272123 RepID=K9ZFV0_ANACC|nr:hypothetical protein Anacy_2157 [Anabaena cylindrica PCC 7122]BAY06874.1 hypothetical protein NIES19_61720 [Anabaena cylindrica PCC 7122]